MVFQKQLGWFRDVRGFALKVIALKDTTLRGIVDSEEFVCTLATGSVLVAPLGLPEDLVDAVTLFHGTAGRHFASACLDDISSNFAKWDHRDKFLPAFRKGTDFYKTVPTASDVGASTAACMKLQEAARWFLTVGHKLFKTETDPIHAAVAYGDERFPAISLCRTVLMWDHVLHIPDLCAEASTAVEATLPSLDTAIEELTCIASMGPPAWNDEISKALKNDAVEVLNKHLESTMRKLFGDLKFQIAELSRIHKMASINSIPAQVRVERINKPRAMHLFQTVCCSPEVAQFYTQYDEILKTVVRCECVRTQAAFLRLPDQQALCSQIAEANDAIALQSEIAGCLTAMSAVWRSPLPGETKPIKAKAGLEALKGLKRSEELITLLKQIVEGRKSYFA